MADNEVTVKIVTEADTTQVNDLKTAIDDIQTSAGQASDSVDQLGASTSTVDGSSMSNAGTDADQLGASADQADTEVQELQSSLDMIEASAMLSVAEQLGSLGAEAENMAQDMNTAAISVGQLATQTGVAEPQMVSLINNISNATFPNEEAMMYVKSLDQIGVSAGNLGQSATDLDKINDAFGLGANKVNSLGQELSVLGVDMNNVSTSFNALAYANANTVGGMDNYYTFLRKYDSQFKELGFNVDQASVIIAAATQKFGGGKAALSGLNDALKESNGDTRALEEALGMQAGSIQNATQLTGQFEGQLQSLADEEAEHKTWLDQLGAAWEDFSLAMSPVLSPLMSFMGVIGDAGSFAVGINGLITLAQTMRESAAAQWLLNIAMDANPIGILIIAITALIAILAYLYFNNEQVRAAIDGLGQSLMIVGQLIWTTIVNAVQGLITWLQNLWNTITNTVMYVVTGIAQVIVFLATLPVRISAILASALTHAVSFATNFVQDLINAAVGAVDGFASYISQLPDKLRGELDAMLQMASDFIMQIANMLTGGAAGMVVGWITGSGEHSPGYMYEAFEGELNAMTKIVPKFNREISSNVRNMGASVPDNFGNHEIGSLTSNISNGSGGDTYNINLTVGSVDKQERVDEIIDAIRNYLHWNNTTAGRTV